MDHPETKKCQQCGQSFARRHQERIDRWRERRFCSLECSNLRRPKADDFPPCLRCETTEGNRRIRGLCGRCYNLVRGTDEMFDYPRETVPSDMVWDEWCLLRSQGFTKREVAQKLGMTYAALDRALCRIRTRMRREGVLT